MSYIVEKWTQQLGKDGAEEALRRHPEIMQMPWQEQEILLRSLERLHEREQIPVTVENSEELYCHYFVDEAPAKQPAFVPKSKEVEQDFFQNATADQLKAYFLAKG
jgi:hypothetical protein